MIFNFYFKNNLNNNPQKTVVFNLFFVGLLLFLNNNLVTAQDKELSWDELPNQYECPECFIEAKFGNCFHSSTQSVPKQGSGWYACHMYMKDVSKQNFDKIANLYPLQTYGDLSVIGFKDVINQWKAENFNAQELIDFSKDNSAKYIVALANHDNYFFNWRKPVLGSDKEDNATTTSAFGYDELRYTTKGDDFYIIVMPPKGGEFAISLLSNLREVNLGKLKKLRQLYDGEKLSFKQSDKKLTTTMHAVSGDSYAVVLNASFK
jgi:hypothetical protein